MRTRRIKPLAARYTYENKEKEGKRDKEEWLREADDAWKAFSTTDILAIGHDIVYRYIRCRHHCGKDGRKGPHVYNLPTFLLLGSRLILTLVTHSSSVGTSAYRPWLCTKMKLSGMRVFHFFLSFFLSYNARLGHDINPFNRTCRFGVLIFARVSMRRVEFLSNWSTRYDIS